LPALAVYGNRAAFGTRSDDTELILRFGRGERPNAGELSKIQRGADRALPADKGKAERLAHYAKGGFIRPDIADLSGLTRGEWRASTASVTASPLCAALNTGNWRRTDDHSFCKQMKAAANVWLYALRQPNFIYSKSHLFPKVATPCAAYAEGGEAALRLSRLSSS
jgi:hypothetical protein